MIYAVCVALFLEQEFKLKEMENLLRQLIRMMTTNQFAAQQISSISSSLGKQPSMGHASGSYL